MNKRRPIFPVYRQERMTHSLSRYNYKQKRHKFLTNLCDKFVTKTLELITKTDADSFFGDTPPKDCIHLAFIVIPVILAAEEQE